MLLKACKYCLFATISGAAIQTAYFRCLYNYIYIHWSFLFCFHYNFSIYVIDFSITLRYHNGHS